MQRCTVRKNVQWINITIARSSTSSYTYTAYLPVVISECELKGNFCYKFFATSLFATRIFATPSFAEVKCKREDFPCLLQTLEVCRHRLWIAICNVVVLRATMTIHAIGAATAETTALCLKSMNASNRSQGDKVLTKRRCVSATARVNRDSARDSKSWAPYYRLPYLVTTVMALSRLILLLVCDTSYK